MDEKSLGIRSEDIDVAHHGGVWREILNKMSWVVGTVYGVPYSSTKCRARETALVLARLLREVEGYPASMKKE